MRGIDWEQRRYETLRSIYSAMLGRSANFKTEEELLDVALRLTDNMINALLKSKDYE